MLNIFDLYDLYAIFTNIRNNPNYPLNQDVLMRVIKTLQNKNCHEVNQIRCAVRAIKDIDQNLYSFCFVTNNYSYIPSIVKENKVYALLEEICEILIDSLHNSFQEADVLADAVHNIPLLLASNNFNISKTLKDSDLKFHKEYYKAVLKKLKV